MTSFRSPFRLGDGVGRIPSFCKRARPRVSLGGTLAAESEPCPPARGAPWVCWVCPSPAAAAAPKSYRRATEAAVDSHRAGAAAEAPRRPFFEQQRQQQRQLLGRSLDGGPSPEAGGGSHDGGPSDGGLASGRGARPQLRSVALGAAGAGRLTRRAHHDPAGAARGANGYHDSYFFTDPTRRLDELLGSRERRDHGELGLPAVRAARDDRRRRRGQLGAHRHQHAERDAPGDEVPDHVAVGQIHLGSGTPSSTKPLLELFYFATGSIVMAIEQTPAGGDEVQTTVGSVPLGTKWSYIIGLTGNTISLVIDAGSPQTFPMSSTFDQEAMYFKAGDYDQSVGSSATVGAKVQFFALTVHHGP